MSRSPFTAARVRRVQEHAKRVMDPRTRDALWSVLAEVERLEAGNTEIRGELVAVAKALSQGDAAEAGPAYYTLVADVLRVGNRPAYDTYVTRDPRHLPVSLICGTYARVPLPGWRLAVLAPNGAVTQEDYYEADGGWTITAVEPVEAVLGPQARVLVAMAEAAKALVGLSSPKTPTAAAYAAAVNARHGDGGWLVRSHADAAVGALEAIGADADWWENVAGGTGGVELLAVAARDLIGTVPGWDRAAYDALTAPWREAFGKGPHPDDDQADDGTEAGEVR